MASARTARLTVSSMQLDHAARGADRHAGSFVVGTVLGGCFVAAGLGIAFLCPRDAARVEPRSPALPDSDQPSASGRWLSWPRRRRSSSPGQQPSRRRRCRAPVGPRRRSPLAAAPRPPCRPDVTAVSTDVVPTEGRPIPQLVVGPFGVAVIHELGWPRPSSARSRTSWERRDARGLDARPSIRSTRRARRRSRAPLAEPRRTWTSSFASTRRSSRPIRRCCDRLSVRSSPRTEIPDWIAAAAAATLADRGPAPARSSRASALPSRPERRAETGSLVGMGSSPVG